MLDGLSVDDTESPAIGLVEPGVSWQEVQDHLTIARSPLLMTQEADGQYRGGYWTEAAPVFVDDLGTDQDEAVAEFREVLRERGQA